MSAARWSWLGPASFVVASTLFVAAAAIGATNGVARNLADAVAFLAYGAIGAVITWRRPRNRVGWVCCAMGVSWQIYLFASTLGLTLLRREGSIAAVDAVLWLPMNTWLAGIGLAPLLLMYFPNGQLLSPRWLPVAWANVAFALLGVLIVGSSTGALRTKSPLLPASGPFYDLIALLYSGPPWTLLVFGLIAAVALVLRIRRSTGLERQQLKWLGYGGLVAVMVATVIAAAGSLGWLGLERGTRQPSAVFLAGIPFAAALTLVPISMAIAILRHGLYDIDVIINRTLVYGLSTAAIAITFFGGIVVLQTPLRAVTGGSELAVAISTLASFAFFQPLRARIQTGVDRRFYRARYDATRTLDELSGRLRDEVDLDAVCSDLLSAVRDTMRPAHSSVWLRERVR
ncbi:MAG: hypothetical protein E6J24_02590 [Chloroflexi bacterium]|nr:MAG: hypothetical protein E6J24_02590 [Chloroflexota bacterium]